MGLFDKLLKAKPEAKPGNPLADPVVKQYFEIICGMRSSFLSSGEEPVSGNARAKKYLEYFLGTPCDTEKLKQALVLYNQSRTDYPTNDIESVLSNFRKSLKNSTTYRLERYEAANLFLQDEIAAATIEYDKVLDVIKDNVNYKHFSQGLDNMSFGGTIKDIVISTSFLDGNTITKKLVFDYLISIYVGRMTNSTYTAISNYTDDIALLALKAVHFEKYKGCRADYTTISDEDCRAFVLEEPAYKTAIDDHPFETEKYVTRFVDRMKKAGVFVGTYTSFDFKCYRIGCVDDYFCDAVCNWVWKEISDSETWMKNEEDISESNDPSDVFSIVFTYLTELANE